MFEYDFSEGLKIKIKKLLKKDKGRAEIVYKNIKEANKTPSIIKKLKLNIFS